MLAAPAVLLVLRRGGQLGRMLVLLYCAAGVTLAYAVLLGTLEEQELYLLLVPSLLIISVAVTLLFDQHRHVRRSASSSRATRLGTVVMGAALTLALGVNLLTCVRWLLQPDDGFVQLIGYVTAHVPAGSVIGATYGDIETPYAAGRQLPGRLLGDPGWPVSRSCPLHCGGVGDDRRGLLKPDPVPGPEPRQPCSAGVLVHRTYLWRARAVPAPAVNRARVRACRSARAKREGLNGGGHYRG